MRVGTICRQFPERFLTMAPGASSRRMANVLYCRQVYVPYLRTNMLVRPAQISGEMAFRIKAQSFRVRLLCKVCILKGCCSFFAQKCIDYSFLMRNVRTKLALCLITSARASVPSDSRLLIVRKHYLLVFFHPCKYLVPT